jgi:hypothetical protein
VKGPTRSSYCRPEGSREMRRLGVDVDIGMQFSQSQIARRGVPIPQSALGEAEQGTDRAPQCDSGGDNL